MKKVPLFLCVICLLFELKTEAQIFTNLQPVQIATNMQFTEGPAWHPDGYLVFSDINGNIIYKWSEQNGLQILVENSGNSNGIVCTKKNEFVLCRHGNRDIASMNTSGVITSVLSGYQNKKFNSPNDLELSYLGSIYFTDPDFGANTASRELAWEGLFCIPYNSTQPVLLDSTLLKPNGLTFADDWRTLYVCETATNTIYSYFLRDEYVLADLTKDKNVFLKLTGVGEIDGMAADVFGNIYVACGDGGIRIFNQKAIEIGQIAFPAKEKVRNLTFGGKYKNLLFVTAGTSIYKVEIRFFGDFIATGLLGVPTEKSVIFNALSDKNLDAYLAYGTSAANLNLKTATTQFPGNSPMEIVLSGLQPNTQYYYQLFYKTVESANFTAFTKGKFVTQRPKGTGFSFAVEADPHLDEASNYLTFKNTLKNILKLNPDFLIDLGDNFLTEKFPIPNEYYMEQRNLLYRNFWDSICHSVPLFLAQGNHEGELRWRSTSSATDMFNTATSVRKKYYPTPQPDGFYSGSEAIENFVGKRENYYAWSWGDALFVVIDPYGYTENRTNDPWCFTLGKTQYDWFRSTLEKSDAKFKFVFAHQLVGGDSYGRGGSEKSDFFEHGGKNADGSYGFDTKRPGWGKPIQQIMIENGVQIYFHGHDHLYAEQPKEGIVYLEVPQPSFPGYTVANDAEMYGYTTGTILPNSGHINVTVSAESAKVDYIGGYHLEIEKKGQINGQIRRSFTVNAWTRTTGLSENKRISEQVEIYTSANTVFVKMPLEMPTQISLLSLTGSKLATLQNGNLSAGTSSFELPENIAKGVYLLIVEGKLFKNYAKIVKL